MRLLRGPLVAAGLYALVLLPPLLAPHGGGHAHARAYLLEFGGIPLTRLLGDVLLNVAAFVPLGASWPWPSVTPPAR